MSERKAKKNDLRVRYTQQVLKEHLLLLLNRKPIAKITVKELCESADINRATFYTHYTDLYDLMQQMKDRMKEHLIHHIKSYISADKTEKRDTLIEFLRYLHENKILYLLLCGETGPDCLREHTWRVTKEYYLGEHEMPPPIYGNYRNELLLSFSTFGITAVIESWLREDMPVTEEELADLFANFTDQG
jgi:AcrR family transcriptional regulator